MFCLLCQPEERQNGRSPCAEASVFPFLSFGAAYISAFKKCGALRFERTAFYSLYFPILMQEFHAAEGRDRKCDHHETGKQSPIGIIRIRCRFPTGDETAGCIEEAWPAGHAIFIPDIPVGIACHLARYNSTRALAALAAGTLPIRCRCRFWCRI